MKRVILSISSLAVGVLLLVLFFYFSLVVSSGTTFFPDFIFLILGLVISSIGVFLFMVFPLRKQVKTLSDRLYSWSKINVHVDNVGDSIIHDLPVGIIVVDKSENIAWINTYATQVFGENLINTPISNITPDFNESKRFDKDFEIIKLKRKFLVTSKKSDGAYFFFDISNLDELRSKNKDLIPGIGFIYLENLSESILNFDLSLQSELRSEILKTLGDWADKYGVYLRQFQDERFVLFADASKVQRMEADRFSIIDQIKIITEKRGIKVGISIGIAVWKDLELDELGEYAQRALYLAIQRGGGQAVVNFYERKIAYYGGKQDSLTGQASRLQTRMDSQTLKEYIEASGNVIVFGHKNSDLDSFGACLLVKEICSQLNRNCFIVVDQEKLDDYVKLAVKELVDYSSSVVKSFVRTEEAVKKITDNTLLIVVDTHMRKLSFSPELFPRIKNKVLIDHHRKNEDDLIDDAVQIIDPSASSSVELCLGLANYITSKLTLDFLQATIMYSAICTDTTNFTSRTSSQTFECIAKLIEHGADISLSKRWLRLDLVRIQDIDRCVAKVQIYRNEFAIVNLGPDLIDDRVFLSQVSEELLNINGVTASFTIACSTLNIVQISARSFLPTNVMIIMEKLGGGGHAQSAATQIPNTTTTQVEQKLKELIDIEIIERSENMKVILLEDIKDRGKENDIIDVAPGFGQYLITEKKAVVASKAELAKLEKKRVLKIKEKEQFQESMKKIKEEIDGKAITLTVNMKADNSLYGSITPTQITDAFDKEYGIVFDKKKIEMPPINGVGTYSVPVILDTKIEAVIIVKIVPAKIE